MKSDIILLHPQHPGNIGFTARAMKTMGFINLVIVSENNIDMNTASITAANAKDVLEKSRIEKSFIDILSDYHFLIAFTARKRYFRNHIYLHELPGILENQPEKVKTGLVFGRENSGLTNKEIDLCQAVATIPTSRELHSLNLSHAVQIVCYELIRKQFEKKAYGFKQRKPATAMEREAIFNKLDIAGERIGLKKQETNKIATIFRTLFEERALEKREAGAIHRFFDQIVHQK